jgi:hypothetical protein
MELVPKKDLKYIESLIADDRIWDSLKMDGMEKHYIMSDLHSKYHYLVGMHKKEPIGMCVFEPRKRDETYDLVIHPIVYPEFRQEHAKGFIEKALDWAKDNLEYDKMLVEIPTYYPENINLAKHFGFKKVGLELTQFRKDGQLVIKQVMEKTSN